MSPTGVVIKVLDIGTSIANENIETAKALPNRRKHFRDVIHLGDIRLDQ